MKRILVLSLSAGSGHIRAGEALTQHINHNSSDIHAEHIDISQFLNKYALFVHKHLYNTVSKNWKWIWGLLYKMTDSRNITLAVNKTTGIQGKWAHRLHAYIRNTKPDIIVCTYHGAPYFIKEICQELHIPIYAMVTDYYAHRFYIKTNVAGFFVPTEAQIQELHNGGIPTEHIFVTGIPIHPRFYKKHNIEQLRQNYQIPNNKNVIVVVGKNYKKELLTEVVERLQTIPNTEIIILGQKVHKSLLNKHTRNIAWTTKMNEYMAIADVVVSKSGGLTTTECIAMQTPLVIVDPIPGQEQANALYIEKMQKGVLCRDITKIDTLVSAYLSHEVTYNSDISSSPASQRILDVLSTTS